MSTAAKHRDAILFLDTVVRPGDLEAIAHELAHAILLRESMGSFANSIDGMRESNQDRHEIATIALQSMAMKHLGLPCSIHAAVRTSLYTMNGEWTHTSLARAVRKHRPNRKAVARFVMLVRALGQVI